MVNAAELVVRVISDSSKARADLDNTASRAGKFSSTMGKMAAPAAGAVLAIGAVAKAAVDSASRTQQAYGALDSVFGKNSGIVKKWAGEAAQSVGLAGSEYAELASVIGAQLKNMGVPMDQVANKTKGLVTMGADLAATFGGTTAEAVEALSSALRGETDPIEKYGVAVKQADIAARMAAEGTDKLTGEAGKAAKTQALLALITEQTADAQGQFARESDSAAGSAQIASAQMENMKSAMGTALLPVVASLAAMFGKLSGFIEDNTTAFQIIIGVMAAVAVAVLAINAALMVYRAGLVVVAAVQKATFLTSPIGLVVLAIMAVVAAVVILWKRSETFRTVVLAVWAAVRTAATVTGNAIRTIFNAVWNAIEAGARGFMEAVRGVMSGVRSVVQAVTGFIREAFMGTWIGIREQAANMREAVSNAFRSVREVVGVVSSAIREGWNNTVSAIRGSVGGLGAILSAPFSAMKGALDAVVGAVQNLIGWLSRIKVPSIKLPSIPGFNMAPPPPATPAGRAAAPRVPVGRAGTSTGASSGPTFIINGAIDPEATARQIRRILAGHDRRVGLA